METAAETETSSSVWASWIRDAEAVHAFGNARSALAYLLRAVGTGRVWLPDYSCPELAASGAGLDVGFYRLDRRLNPDLEGLDRRLLRGDAVVVISHFGRPISHIWQDFIRVRNDVTWIEDSAQTLYTGEDPLAPFRIFSPRKLLGVPDGGILVDYEGQIAQPDLFVRPLGLLSAPYRLRASDPDCKMREIWYRAFREAEAAMNVENRAMSVSSIRVLKTRALGPIAARRRANFRALGEWLGQYAFMTDFEAGWAPLGFPVVVRDAGKMVSMLADFNVFAPRHWRSLAAPQQAHEDAHWLADRLVTLPCDQRYEPDDMARVGALVKELIG